MRFIVNTFLLVFLSVQLSFALDSLELKNAARLDRINEMDSLKITLDNWTVKNDEESTWKNYFYSRYYRFIEPANRDLRLKFLYQAQVDCDFKCGKEIQANIFDELTIVLKSGGELERKKCLEYSNQAIELRRQIKDDNKLGLSYVIRGNCFHQFWMFETEKIGEDANYLLDSFFFYYTTATTLNLSNYLKNYIEKTLPSIYIDKKQYSEAEKALEELIAQNRFDTTNELFVLQANLADCKRLLGKTKEAEKNLSELWNDSIAMSNDHLKERVMHYNFMLALDLKDIEGMYKWYDLIGTHRHAVENKANAEAMEKYNSERLEVQLTKEQAQTLRNRLWALVFGGLSLLLVLLAFGIYRIQKLRKKQVENELENTKIKAVLDATRAQMKGEQKERQAIASTLHDQLASLLTAADLHLTVAEKSQDTQPSLVKAKGILKEVNIQVRDISHQLVSPSLMKFGLGSSLATLTEQMSTEEKPIIYHSDVNGKRFERSKEIFIYRSCAELIQNAQKYSNGRLIKVSIWQRGTTLHLKVFDDGTSLDKDSTKLGFGLVNIKDRAHSFGGDFTLRRTEEGTTAELIIVIESSKLS